MPLAKYRIRLTVKRTEQKAFILPTLGSFRSAEEFLRPLSNVTKRNIYKYFATENSFAPQMLPTPSRVSADSRLSGFFLLPRYTKAYQRPEYRIVEDASFRKYERGIVFVCRSRQRYGLLCSLRATVPLPVSCSRGSALQEKGHWVPIGISGSLCYPFGSRGRAQLRYAKRLSCITYECFAPRELRGFYYKGNFVYKIFTF